MPGVMNQRSSDAILAVARRVILLLLVLAMAGIFGELLLAEHFEDVWQLVPLVLLVLGLAVVAWHARVRSATSTRALRAIMTLFVLSGFVGIFLH
jgi:uncharacterized membrane protein